MMGEGFAIIPSNNSIVSPVAGTITTIFPTKHALGILTDNGLEILVHIGIDTVQLKGEPFELEVSEGDKISAGQLLVRADFKAIASAGKQTDVVVVVTNSQRINAITLEKVKQVSAGDFLGSINCK